MTDNEIIKALECCMNGRCDDDCPFRETKEHCYRLDDLILDLINRQKAEIELLKADNKNYIKVAETQQSLSMERFFEIKRLTESIEKRTTELDRLTIYFDKAVEKKLKTAKAEAIKEFAEKLESKLANNTYISAVGYEAVVFDMHKLVKEKVGDENG